jgi:hypothetical protein
LLPRSFFALALGLAGCAAQVGDPDLLDEAEAQEAELLRTRNGNLTIGGGAQCWWSEEPQLTCDLPYTDVQADGRVPTCNTCSCQDCVRFPFWGSQLLRVRLREVGSSILGSFHYEIHDPAQLRPYVVVGVGSQTNPSDYELVTIDPNYVIGSNYHVVVPQRFQGQNVYVWFVRNDGGKLSTPLPPSYVYAP